MMFWSSIEILAKIADRLYNKYIGGEDTVISTFWAGTFCIFLLEEYDKVVEILRKRLGHDTSKHRKHGNVIICTQ